jgi:glucose uptake protein GlcU
MSDRLITALCAFILLLIAAALHVLPERLLSLIVKVVGLIALAVITVGVNYSSYKESQKRRGQHEP